jgi:hypothetical protein
MRSAPTPMMRPMPPQMQPGLRCSRASLRQRRSRRQHRPPQHHQPQQRQPQHRRSQRRQPTFPRSRRRHSPVRSCVTSRNPNRFPTPAMAMQRASQPRSPPRLLPSTAAPQVALPQTAPATAAPRHALRSPPLPRGTAPGMPQARVPSTRPCAARRWSRRVGAGKMPIGCGPRCRCPRITGSRCLSAPRGAANLCRGAMRRFRSLVMASDWS